MATAGRMPDLTGLDKTSQLDALRRQMAAIPGRRHHAPADHAPPPEPQRHRQSQPVDAGSPKGSAQPDTSAAPQHSKTLRTIPVPPPLAELLPHGGLARGHAVSITGSASVLTGIVAAATAAGHHVALIGQRRFGLLAAHEHGGDLPKIAQIDTGSGDPLDVASICLDGIDIVVTTLGGRDVPPTRARSLLARTRSHASLLLLTDGRMPGIDVRIDTRTVAVHGIGHGRGRLRGYTLETTVAGRGISHRTGRYTLTSNTFGPHRGLHWQPDTTAEHALQMPEPLAVAR